MPTFTESVERMSAEQASIRNLFEGDSRVRDRRQTPEYRRMLLEAAQFVAAVESGRRPMWQLREAMTTSDFTNLFADVLDRQLLGSYMETPPVWQSFARRSTVADFRSVKRFAVDGAEGALPQVGQREEYPEAALSDSVDSYSVGKYGRRVDLSWEAMVNDDLDAFRSIPGRLARAARRTENKFATQLYVDANGPHASLYTSGNKNQIVTANGASADDPKLSIAALRDAMTVLSKMVDADGEPITVDAITLVVPPALEVTAENILNATELWVSTDGGNSTQQVHVANWMRNRMTLQIDPYIPIIASTANGGTSWFLFANPNTGRPALEVGFLRGYETPGLYERVSNARAVGGAAEAIGAFEDDSMAWKVRHVVGGARLTNTGGAKATVASKGTGTAT